MKCGFEDLTYKEGYTIDDIFLRAGYNIDLHLTVTYKFEIIPPYTTNVSLLTYNALDLNKLTGYIVLEKAKKFIEINKVKTLKDLYDNWDLFKIQVLMA